MTDNVTPTTTPELLATRVARALHGRDDLDPTDVAAGRIGHVLDVNLEFDHFDDRMGGPVSPDVIEGAIAAELMTRSGHELHLTVAGLLAAGWEEQVRVQEPRLVVLSREPADLWAVQQAEDERYGEERAAAIRARRERWE